MMCHVRASGTVRIHARVRIAWRCTDARAGGILHQPGRTDATMRPVVVPDALIVVSCRARGSLASWWFERRGGGRAPTGHPAVLDDAAGVGAPGRDLREAKVAGNLRVLRCAPAFDRSVVVDPAGVKHSRADRPERAARRDGLTTLALRTASIVAIAPTPGPNIARCRPLASGKSANGPSSAAAHASWGNGVRTYPRRVRPWRHHPWRHRPWRHRRGGIGAEAGVRAGVAARRGSGCICGLMCVRRHRRIEGRRTRPRTASDPEEKGEEPED